MVYKFLAWDRHIKYAAVYTAKFNTCYVFFILDPVPSGERDGHFKTFDESYGHPTSEKYCPSLQGAVNQGSEISFRVSAETVRSVVYCTDCEKPRYIFKFKFNIQCYSNIHVHVFSYNLFNNFKTWNEYA